MIPGEKNFLLDAFFCTPVFQFRLHPVCRGFTPLGMPTYATTHGTLRHREKKKKKKRKKKKNSMRIRDFIWCAWLPLSLPVFHPHLQERDPDLWMKRLVHRVGSRDYHVSFWHVCTCRSVSDLVMMAIGMYRVVCWWTSTLDVHRIRSSIDPTGCNDQDKCRQMYQLSDEFSSFSIEEWRCLAGEVGD